MNDMQKKFFKHIADIQETCVEICLSKHKKYNDNEARAMLYNITYEFAVEIMEMIDGYSEYSHDKHDINSVIEVDNFRFVNLPFE